MKSETLNSILIFVLGVLVVFGVIFALKFVFITREFRSLQSDALRDQAIVVQTEQLYNDAQAYNQKYPSVELRNILQAPQGRPTPTH